MSLLSQWWTFSSGLATVWVVILLKYYYSSVFRHSEVGYTSPVASDYCAVSAEHFLCILDKPSETSNIVRKEFTEEFKIELLTKHNR